MIARRLHPPGLILALVMLAACSPPQASPTPTLIVLRPPAATATHIPTSIPVATIQPPPVTYTTTPTIEPPPTHTPSPTPAVSYTPSPSRTPLLEAAATGCQGQATGGNLLINGGFEGGQHPQDDDQVQVPDGWTAFWRQVGSTVLYDSNNTEGYQRPEMIVITKLTPYTDPPRILEGNQAFRMEGNQRAFDAGIFQQVATSPGDVVCLTGAAQAWSNHYSDNPFGSTLNTGDDQRNANFQLGIDFQGGTDPFATTILWGAAQHLYDSYGSLSAVKGTASGGTVTIFVRGVILWRFKHNEMFFDGISLVKLTP